MPSGNAPQRERQKSRIELLASLEAQLPEFQEKLLGPTDLAGVKSLASNRDELVKFLTSEVPEGLVWQAEILHKHSFFGEDKVFLMIRVDSDEFQNRGHQIPVLFGRKKRKSNTLNVKFLLPDGTLIAKLRETDRGSFILYDNGANPNNPKKCAGKAIRKQIGGCRITNIGALEPIKMKALLPSHR